MHTDSAGRPYVDFRDAVSMMREEERPHWTFDGPRAASEYLDAIVSGCGNPSTFHAEWQRLSGVSEGSAVCHDHRLLMEVIRAVACVDQLDLKGCASPRAWCDELFSSKELLSETLDTPTSRGWQLSRAG